MKNNIDEDIKLAKEVASDLRTYVDDKKVRKGRAISSVVSWLENYREDYNHRCQLAIDRAKEIEKLNSELYIYKKMTEYFAVKLYDLANEKMKEEYTTAQECCEYAKLRDICVRDMIISARKEVDKDSDKKM